jgi:hypothetical protein
MVSKFFTRLRQQFPEALTLVLAPKRRRSAAVLLVGALIVALGAAAPTAIAKKKGKRVSYTVSIKGQQTANGTVSSPSCGERTTFEQVSFVMPPNPVTVTKKPGQAPRFDFFDEVDGEPVPGAGPVFGLSDSVYRDESPSDCRPPDCGQTRTGGSTNFILFAANDRIWIDGKSAESGVDYFCFYAFFWPFFAEGANDQPFDAALSEKALMKAKRTLTASASGTETVFSKTVELEWKITLEPRKKK